MRVLIRPRRDSDLAACAGLVRDVHALDRYPRFLPEDLTSFLAPPATYGSWVAEHGGQVTGHIALLPHGLPSALQTASNALGRPADQLAVVARLLVSPKARGKGTAGCCSTPRPPRRSRADYGQSSTSTQTSPRPSPYTKAAAGSALEW
jgi:Acetyltransferase (GNAT) family